MDSPRALRCFRSPVHDLFLEANLKILVLLIVGFLAGSTPTGYLVARRRGIDLQRTGSGNIGATNVLRTTGKGPALLTLLGDTVKGIVPVLLARAVDAGTLGEGLVGLASILGHDFSVFLRLKGGKGVATSLGVLSVYAPQTALVTGIIWLVTAALSRYSSLAALVSFGLLPLGVFLLDGREKVLIACCITGLIFLKHKDNISRLLAGTETKIGRRQ